MAWTTLNFSVGAILTAAQMNNLYANFAAMAAGDSGSPTIQSAALGSSIITQAKMASSSVGQSQVKVSGDSQSSIVGSTSAWAVAATGGNYTLGWFLGTNGGNASIASAITVNPNPASTYGHTLQIYNNNGSSFTVYFYAYYISASPPYDLGDGEIPLFVFAAIDSQGKVTNVSVAKDPPWAYNGPTSIVPDFYDKNGKPFQRKRQIEVEMPDWASRLNKAITRKTILDRLKTDPMVDVEITQAVKNADMDIIPHPFAGNDLTGKTIVLLDPMSPVTQHLLGIHDAARLDKNVKSVNDLLHDGDLIVGNIALNRKAPKGVMPVSVAWR